MVVHFKDQDIYMLCTDEKTLKKKIGLENVGLRQIQKKLDALLAFQNLGDVPRIPPYRLHLLYRDYAGCYAVDINGKYRLIIVPTWPQGIAEKDENLKYVTEIMIKGITNYHE